MDSAIESERDYKQISITNSSNYTIYLAYAFYVDGWETIGWINVEANGTNVINLPSYFNGNSIYWYAENSNNYVWSNTSTYFCISHPDAFHYYSSNSVECKETVGFNQLNLTGNNTELCCFD